MSILLPPEKPLPSTIASETIELGGHEGNTTVVDVLTITTSVIGDIEVKNGGKLIIDGDLIGNLSNSGVVEINGLLKGNVINTNQGVITLNKGGQLQGNMDTSGVYNLHGQHNGETMNLYTGSYSFITGFGKIDMYSQKGATMNVTETARIQRSDQNSGRTMQNSGDITISGGSTEHSLTTTGSVTITGNATFTS